MRLPAGGLQMSEPAFHHDPVMVDRVVELFGPVPPGVVVDATVGGGGHANALLDAHDHLTVLGLDRDEDAVLAATEALAPHQGRAQVHRGSYSQIGEQGLGDEGGVVGLLFDLGVSSPQLERAERGFSFRRDGPLDMRMDRRQRRTAAEVVNEYPLDELVDVLAGYGDERHARRLAAAIVDARPLGSTGELADVVRAAMPARGRRRGHPARRTFQAIRIEVNEELDRLATGLDRAIDVLEPGGRCVVLSYHSGEDRLVKQRFREAATGGCTCPPRLPCVCGAEPLGRVLTSGARKASPEEVARNPRAESARLRAFERIPNGRAGDER